MYIQKYYKVIRVIKDGDGGATPLYIENVSNSDGVFKLQKNSSPTYIPNLIYRIDNGEWFQYDVASLPSITVPSGSKIYFRGDNVNGFNHDINYYYYFNFNQNYNIGGYITSLLVLDYFNTITDIPKYSFNYLFNSQSNLLNAENLIVNNIITVGEYGFRYCFYSCSSLTTAPSFDNVTTVGGNGFDSCFQNCTSLTTAPRFENITTVKVGGFRVCFQNCTSLTTPPRFNNIITTTENQVFQYCFNGCTSLQLVYAPRITTWDTNKFFNWLQNVSPTGIIYKPANLTIPTGTSGVPEGWTTVDY